MATLIDNPKRARQLARAIASDLTLYHEPKILEGIANDNLFDVMADEINEGRELFKRRAASCSRAASPRRSSASTSTSARSSTCS
jgi:hypothetical protein